MDISTTRLSPLDRLQRAQQRLPTKNPLQAEDSLWLGRGLRQAGRDDTTIDAALGLGRHWGAAVNEPEALQALFLLFQGSNQRSKRQTSHAIERELKAYARGFNIDGEIPD